MCVGGGMGNVNLMTNEKVIYIHGMFQQINSLKL